jgi:transketolase
VDTIDIRFSTSTEHAMQGILNLNHDNAVTETLNRIKELLQEYQVAEARQKEDIENAGREILHQMRISGSAVSRINPQARDEWQKKLETVAQPFAETLKKLKQRLPG